MTVNRMTVVALLFTAGISTLMGMPVCAQTLPSAALQKGAITTEDKRLQTRITIAPGQYRVSELLENLSAQSGVTLTASDRDEVAGEVLFADLEDVKLTDVMKALVSLYSYPSATWRWNQENKDQVVYTLSRRRRGTEVSDALRAKIQDKCVQLEKDMLAHCGSDDELNTIMKKYGVPCDPFSLSTIRKWLNLVKECVPESDIDPLLRGTKSVDVSTATFSKVAAKHESVLGGLLGSFRDNLSFETREDDEMGYLDLWAGTKDVDALGNVQSRMYRSLTFCTLYGEKQARNLAPAWCMKEDSRTNPAIENQPFRKLPDSSSTPNEKPLPPENKQYPEVNYLNELSRQTKMSYLARLPHRAKTSFPELGYIPYEKPIGQFLNDGLREFNIFHKWNNGILLLSHSAWIKPDVVVPWEFTKAVRQSIAEFDLTKPPVPWTYDRIYELALLGSNLSFDQWSRAGEESLVIDNMATWYPLLAAAQKSETFRKELTDRRGIAADRVIALSRDSRWTEQFDDSVFGSPIARVRVTQGTSGPSLPFINIIYLNASGKAIGNTFIYFPTKQPEQI